MTAFPHLFSEIDIGPHRFANRIMMGSMHTGLEGRDGGIERLAAFYAERAKAGTGLIVTGGYAPNRAGLLGPEPTTFDSETRAREHRRITDSVHDAGGRILLQLLHSGRYGFHENIVAPSEIRSPINRETPRALTAPEIEVTIDDFAAAAALARAAGYDGVEIMGSEGYLITQFLAPRTNRRDDDWGGSLENRARFALETVRRVRAATADDFIIMFRLSALDLVEDALGPDETIWLAREVEAAGADILDTGIGWHEARVPTIAAQVPRAAFANEVGAITHAVTVPVIATNRINVPELAERIIADGTADMVSMARPLLADAAFADKARRGAPETINTCIACNQACLDHYFVGQVSSCLVNPRACHETEISSAPVSRPKRIAVVGAGPAGLAAAEAAASRGHGVTLSERESEIGGQFRLARAVPGKEEFDETIRFFETRLAELGIDTRLGTQAEALDLAGAFDEVIVAAGVVARSGVIAGEERANVLTYAQALSGEHAIGERVAIIGAGGIGYDVALTLSHEGDRAHLDRDAFLKRWGIGVEREDFTPTREVTIFQRSEGATGRHLGRTTGWIHRASLKHAGVEIVTGVAYDRIDDSGLHFSRAGEPRTLGVDTVVICAGQEANDGLVEQLEAAGLPTHVIGGAREPREIDAKRAFDEGVRLAAAL